VYQYLEPLYNDYRKVRLRHDDGSFGLTHMDEVVDQLINNEYMFDIALPRIPNRSESLCLLGKANALFFTVDSISISDPRHFQQAKATTQAKSAGL